MEQAVKIEQISYIADSPRLKPPLPYLGGKYYLAKKIIAYFPPHEFYVEPFGGGANVLLAKKPSKFEIYNDINDYVTNFFRVLQKNYDEFMKIVQWIPYSESEYHRWHSKIQSNDRLEAAIGVFVVANMGFGGYRSEKKKQGFGHGACITFRRHTGKWFNKVDALHQIRDRFKHVLIHNREYSYILDFYDKPNTLFYIDPPYLMETRTGGDRYKYELSREQHIDLVNKLLNIKGKAILSGYKNDIYAELEKNDWQRVDFNMMLCSKNAKNYNRQREYRVDCIWISPNAIKQTSLFTQK